MQLLASGPAWELGGSRSSTARARSLKIGNCRAAELDGIRHYKA